MMGKNMEFEYFMRYMSIIIILFNTGQISLYNNKALYLISILILHCHHKVGPDTKNIHSKENLLVTILLEKRNIKMFRQQELDPVMHLRKNPTSCSQQQCI